MTENLHPQLSTINKDALTPFERAELNAYFFAKNIDFSVSIQAFFDAEESATDAEKYLLEKTYILFLEETLTHVEYN